MAPTRGRTMVKAKNTEPRSTSQTKTVNSNESFKQNDQSFRDKFNMSPELDISAEFSLLSQDFEKHALNLQDVIKHEHEVTSMLDAVQNNREFKSAFQEWKLISDSSL